MQGTIAQTVALTTYGGAYLAGSPRVDPAAFYPANSTFAFCEYVRFVVPSRGVLARGEASYADDPPAWLARLKGEGALRLRLVYVAGGGQKIGRHTVPDRMLAGFVGGGSRWLIEAIGPDGVDLWEGRWDIGDREREDRRIWRVTYGRVASALARSDDQRVDLPALKGRLVEVLEAIRDFARRQKLGGFAGAFDAGLTRLSSPEPLAGSFHSDLVPEGMLPLVAAQMLAAAQVAWVFGGMGSWNDLWFEGDDQAVYDRLSEKLFGLLNAAIVAAVNNGAPPSGPRGEKRWWQIRG